MNRSGNERITIADLLPRLDHIPLSDYWPASRTYMLAEHYRNFFDSRTNLYLAVAGKVFAFRWVCAARKSNSAFGVNFHIAP
jgi:hypothetical protein